MYKHICKECGNTFENKHKNQKYCSKECFITSRNKSLITEMVGKKVGKLTIIDFAYQQGKRKYFKCQCECGNIVVVERDSLIENRTKSCGCIRKKKSKESLKNKISEFKKSNYVDNTSLSQIKANFKNNTSGCKGVCWDKNNLNWRAYIYFQNKRYNLGSYKDINLAIKARKDAEEKYFKPILEKYEKR